MLCAMVWVILGAFSSNIFEIGLRARGSEVCLLVARPVQIPEEVFLKVVRAICLGQISADTVFPR
jgi:hypothetical protein